jgi:hypothetical protein
MPSRKYDDRPVFGDDGHLDTPAAPLRPLGRRICRSLIGAALGADFIVSHDASQATVRGLSDFMDAVAGLGDPATIPLRVRRGDQEQAEEISCAVLADGDSFRIAVAGEYARELLRSGIVEIVEGNSGRFTTTWRMGHGNRVVQEILHALADRDPNIAAGPKRPRA